MTYLVPYDDGELSRAALERAASLGRSLDRPVLAVTVVPRGNEEYARERGWLREGEAFDLDRVEDRIERRVEAVAPEAEVRVDTVSRWAPPGTVAGAVRRVARDVDPRMVVLGSDNAGNVVTSVATVGQGVATDEAYDVLIVRRPDDAARQDS